MWVGGGIDQKLQGTDRKIAPSQGKKHNHSDDLERRKRGGGENYSKK